jgi:hypothetical protein
MNLELSIWYSLLLGLIKKTVSKFSLIDLIWLTLLNIFTSNILTLTSSFCWSTTFLFVVLQDSSQENKIANRIILCVIREIANVTANGHGLTMWRYLKIVSL